MKERQHGWDTRRVHLGHVAAAARMILKQILKKECVKMWTAFVCCLRIQMGDEHLRLKQ
jgi:hypothetical protein